MYSNTAPPPVAESTHVFYPNFDLDPNMNFYSDWLFPTSFTYPFADQPQPELTVQRSPTNSASTNTSSTGGSFSAWDESWSGPGGGNTTSDSSRTSVSGRSGRSRRSEKRKREVDQGDNIPPSSWVMPQMGDAAPPRTQPSRSRPTRRPPHNPLKYALHSLSWNKRLLFSNFRYVALSTQFVYAVPNRRKILA